ncbi:MAG: type II toxin-antitoxin system prevent-host-death family antitoxin [Thermodesulfobacteriota bacterium]
MQTVGATDANRHFSNLLKQAAQGKEFLVIARGKPVATIAPVRNTHPSRMAARRQLLERLGRQETVRVEPWSRDELYDRGS